MEYGTLSCTTNFIGDSNLVLLGCKTALMTTTPLSIINITFNSIQSQLIYKNDKQTCKSEFFCY